MRSVCPVVATLASFLWGAAARAQSETTVFGLGTAGITYTDNLYNAPSTPLPGANSKQPAWYVLVAPGIGIGHERENSGYALTYTHSFLRYLTTVEAESNGDQLTAAADYELSTVDRLALDLTGSRSSTATMLTEPAVQGQPQPDSSGTYYSALATETLAHELSPSWNGTQTASFGVAQVTNSRLPEPWRFTATGGLSANYERIRDAWAFGLQGTYFHSRAASRGVDRIEPMSYAEAGPTASWRHDIDKAWASIVSAGLAASYRPEANPKVALAPPRVSAGLNWQRDAYSATLLYSASTNANLFTNRVYFSDAIALSGSWLLLPRQQISFTTVNTVSAHRALVAPPGEDDSTIYAWTANAALAWTPDDLPRFALVYLHAGEITPASAAAQSDFRRDQVTLTVTWQYPQITLDRLGSPSPFRVSAPPGESDDAPTSAAVQVESNSD